ncbi:uncharacterized protein LOC114828727 isoform X2 [Esox lucius]|uniref:uncharacterized protein LOC114828727 isoform X2 n=1 Tax=Esox lucius TaxID=8010 RepID=UPI0014771771|nr:uncharacterized protein LOC114828727 isoform X2 [Esox lucius]
MNNLFRMIFLKVLFQLVSLGITLNCNVTQHHNGTTTYHLSETPPSESCVSQWMLPNGSTLSFNHEANFDMLLVLTNQSITSKFFLGPVKYTLECVKPKVLIELQCNCTLKSCILKPNLDNIEITELDGGVEVWPHVLWVIGSCVLLSITLLSIYLYRVRFMSKLQRLSPVSSSSAGHSLPATVLPYQEGHALVNFSTPCYKERLPQDEQKKVENEGEEGEEREEEEEIEEVVGTRGLLLYHRRHYAN